MDRELFAKKQISRMGQLKGFPKEFPEAVGELIDALMTAPSEEIARDVITSFVEDADAETPCPFPKQIRSAALDLLTAREGEILADPLCPKCGGIGEIVVFRGGLSGSSRCDCFARRPPVDWSKVPGYEPIGDEFRTQLAGAAKKLGGGK